ncbi:MAG TPA: nucleotidyltransferase domain-containing protein [Thermoanaerobaculia bacterium]|jgi:predicted nucleotidyltransferase|nr:nucleotidyltransferase domain-containing protein [Thermoanaerobaculia bacterium]
MSALPQPIRDVVLELEKGLRELYGERFRGLLLYGSYARGTAWEGSDVDLLLLLRGPVNPIQEILRLEPVKWPLSLDANLVLSVMPVDAAAFERGENMFLRVVRKEAVPAAA